jgi:hypothetical protein
LTADGPYVTILGMPRRRPVKAKNATRLQPQAPVEHAPDAASVLPMAIQVGDRFIDQNVEWEVLTRPAAMHGGKTLRAMVQRPGLPPTKRAMSWAAHERVTVRRSPRSAA